MRDASVGHQCPECVALGRRTQRPARTAFGGGAAGRHGYVTKTLIGLNVVVMLISVASSGAGSAVAGGGLGGLMGNGTPLTRWGSVLGLAHYQDFSLHGVAEGEKRRHPEPHASAARGRPLRIGDHLHPYVGGQFTQERSALLVRDPHLHEGRR